jgi:hypothetical protein|tara:strand:+ start:40702 stop:41100 length:399 start_codon:yes stop_codon:yes gene_type:complete
MKIIKSTFPYKTILFWLGIFVIFLFATDVDSMSSFLYVMIPVYFFILTYRFVINKITITDNEIIAAVPFEKDIIPRDKVKSFEVKKKNLAIQIIFGIPKEVTQVEYNKYDTIQLNSADPILLEALSKNLGKE